MKSAALESTPLRVRRRYTFGIMQNITSEVLQKTLRAFRGVFVAVGSFSFVMNLLMLMPAIYMLQIYDRVLASRNEFTLLMLTLIMLGLYALEAILELVRSRVMVRASSALDLRLGEQVFDASFRHYLAVRNISKKWTMPIRN